MKVELSPDQARIVKTLRTGPSDMVKVEHFKKLLDPPIEKNAWAKALGPLIESKIVERTGKRRASTIRLTKSWRNRVTDLTLPERELEPEPVLGVDEPFLVLAVYADGVRMSHDDAGRIFEAMGGRR